MWRLNEACFITQNDDFGDATRCEASYLFNPNHNMSNHDTYRKSNTIPSVLRTQKAYTNIDLFTLLNTYKKNMADVHFTINHTLV